MSANAARIELTPEERSERAALRRRFDRQFGARAIDHPSQTRRPLGLSIIDGPEDATEFDEATNLGDAEAHRIVALSIARLSPENLARPLTVEESFCALETSLAATLGGDAAAFADIKKLRADVSEIKTAQRLEVAELKILVSELKAEVSGLRSIQEGQRIQSRGEQGVAGPRGVPGDRGPIGPAGPQGPRGDAAMMVVSWEPTPERYLLTPVYADGTRGVPANLTGLFEQYDQSVRDDGEE
jgi:hypothetical protein